MRCGTICLYGTVVSSFGDTTVFSMDIKQKKSIPRVLRGLLLAAVPLLCLLLGLCVGRMNISPGEILSALGARLGLLEAVSGQIDSVIFHIRLPRLILAAAAGAGLSVAGCAFQSEFSNPLATPDTLGVASGASFGAALGLLLGCSMLGIQLIALGFGLLAVALTALSGARLEESRSTPILAGIMVGSLFNALVSLIKFLADTESQLPAITYFLMGSLEGADYGTLLLGIPPILLGILVLFLLRWRMNLLPLSDDEATSAGVNVRALRRTVQLSATLITASCVSMCGQVGWVGLLVPHICRMRFGSDHRVLIPASISLGAALMILVDTAARTVSPKEIPISILTALIGAPFFIYLLRRSGGWRL